MPAVRTASVAALCLLLFGCGSSEPRSPLILGKEGANALPGPRTLTSAQTRALKEVIASAGRPCDEIEGTFLRDTRADGSSESWDVRCGGGDGFSVMIFADGSPAVVTPCFNQFLDGSCGRGRYRERQRSGPSGELNPDLGKLLEPMTAKDGKAD